MIQSTSETPQGPLFLDIYPGENCRGTIYADDGHSMAYTRQGFLRQEVRCTRTAAGMDIDFEPREGLYQPWWRQVTLRVHHWTHDARVALDGKHIQDLAPRDAVLNVTIDDPRRKSRLSLRSKSGR